MSRPSILFCYRYGLLGGVSAQLLNRYPYLSREYDVTIVYEQDYGMAGRFPAGTAIVAPTAQSRRDAIRDARADLVVVIDSPNFIEAWREVGSPGRLVLEVHTTTANVSYLRRREQFEDVSHIVTVSSYMERLLREHEMDAIAPITVVPNCLQDIWRDTQSLRLPVLDGKPIVWVGKLDSHKRWRTALDLMDQLSEDRALRLRPILIGGLTSPEPEVRALTTRLATSTGLADAVWWPRLEYDRMPVVYAAVAANDGVHLSTTMNESFGMAVAESVLQGCPVIAPAVGALPELLPAAALYRPEDWAQARAKAHLALTDMSFRAELLSTADHIRELTSPERAADAYRTVVAGVLGDPVAAAQSR